MNSELRNWIALTFAAILAAASTLWRDPVADYQLVHKYEFGAARAVESISITLRLIPIPDGHICRMAQKYLSSTRIQALWRARFPG